MKKLKKLTAELSDGGTISLKNIVKIEIRFGEVHACSVLLFLAAIKILLA